MIMDYQRLLGKTMGYYRLEELVEQRPYGPLFLARHQTTKITYLLRLLSVELSSILAERTAFLDHFQQVASQLQTFRHPYILSVLDAGQHDGVPYLVYPQIPIRTFTTRLEQNGALDAATVGRYLDQLAGALEYAHEHGMVHGALSTDTMYLQLDGRLIVTDFGVQRILEGNRSGVLARQAYQLADSAAPEQLQGQLASIETDVYAMGSVLYRLLVGYPLYAGASLAEISYQTLNAPIPLLSVQRTDLPAELDDVLAHALAKLPAYRYHRPGVLANAYHRIVAPQVASRIPFVETDPQPLAAPRRESSRYTEEDAGNTNVFEHSSTASSSAITSPPPPPAYLSASALPYPAPLRINRTRAIILVAVALLVVLGGTLAILQNRTAAAGDGTGMVHFSDVAGGHSNGLNITFSGLTAPPSDTQYQAWLIDAANEHILALGMLLTSNHTYALTYQPADPTINLLNAGNQIEVTQEHGQSQTPLGKVVLSGFFPPKTFVHIQHLMSAFPSTPGKIGLLVGLVGQANLLSTAMHQLQTDGNQNPDFTHCLLVNSVDILEGTTGAHYRPLPAQCQTMNITAGDGFGIVSPTATQGYQGTGYLALAADHATLALQQPDITAPMRAHAQRVITALNTVKGWATTLDGDLLSLLNNPNNPGQLTAAVALADEIATGANGTTSNPSSGGALLAYAEGQLMADLPLIPATH